MKGSICQRLHSLLCESIKVHGLTLQRNNLIFKLMWYRRNKDNRTHTHLIILAKLVLSLLKKNYLVNEKSVIFKSNCVFKMYNILNYNCYKHCKKKLKRIVYLKITVSWLLLIIYRHIKLEHTLWTYCFKNNHQNYS